MKNIEITAALLRKFKPCYDPSEVMPEDEEITLKEAIIKYRNSVKSDDIIWLLCRNEFMSDKEMRLFAVWCAREALKLVESPDPRSVAACDVSEKYANGEATDEELAAAWAAASAAARSTACTDACNAASSARTAAWAAASDARSAAWAGAWDATRSAARAGAWDTTRSAARAARSDASAARSDAWYDGWDAARDTQIDKLLTYFE